MDYTRGQPVTTHWEQSTLADGTVTVYYDVECRLCRPGVRWLRRLLLLRNTCLVPAQDSLEMRQLMAGANSWIVVGPDGRQRLEFEGLTYLNRQSVWLWPLSYLLRAPGVPVLGRRLYRWAARHRHLGRGPELE